MLKSSPVNVEGRLTSYCNLSYLALSRKYMSRTCTGWLLLCGGPLVIRGLLAYKTEKLRHGVELELGDTFRNWGKL